MFWALKLNVQKKPNNAPGWWLTGGVSHLWGHSRWRCWSKSVKINTNPPIIGQGWCELIVQIHFGDCPCEECMSLFSPPFRVLVRDYIIHSLLAYFDNKLAFLMVVEVSLFDVCAWTTIKIGVEMFFFSFFQSQLAVCMFNPTCFSAQCPFFFFFFDKHVCSGIIAQAAYNLIRCDVFKNKRSWNLHMAKSWHFVCVCFHKADSMYRGIKETEDVSSSAITLWSGSNKKLNGSNKLLPSYTLRLSTWRWIGGPSITKGEKRAFYWRLRMWGDAL